MTVIEFKSCRTDIVFCLVDTTHQINDPWAKEVTKNIADFAIANLFSKGYTVLQGLDEDQLLRSANTYKWACVFAAGTEFINGTAFFDYVENLIKSEFFICGHILDRKDAFYELHQQCYLINLEQYRELGSPNIGKQQLGHKHRQNKPWRSTENFHDDYTPLWVSGGDEDSYYSHKCHGWHILGMAFDKDLKVLAWNQTARESKRYNYPESSSDFLQQSQWLYFRERYCANEFVHNVNTEYSNGYDRTLQQLIIPASGTLYLDLLDTNKPCRVIFYDYNTKALDHWREHAPVIDNIHYEFIQWDLLGQQPDLSFIDPSLPTFINFSNIFSYEGTCAFSPLKYRLYKENQLLQLLNKHIPDATVNFSLRAACGFYPVRLQGKVYEFEPIDINLLQKPSWHINQDWL